MLICHVISNSSGKRQNPSPDSNENPTLVLSVDCNG